MQYKSREVINISFSSIKNFIYQYFGDDINFSDTQKNIYDGEFHFKNQIRYDEFKDLLLLDYEGAIKLSILGFNDSYKHNNNEFKILLEKYQLYEGGILGRMTKNTLLDKIKSKLRIPINLKLSDRDKMWKIQGYKSISIYREWDELKDKLPQYSSFDIKIKINPSRFFDIFFIIVSQEKDYNRLTNNKIVRELYNDISKKIDNKLSHEGEIKIFESFDNYIKNKYSIFPVLCELYYSQNLFIKSIGIKERTIYFILSELKNIDLKIFENALCNIIGKKIFIVKFEYNSLKVNGEEVVFKSKNTKTFKMISLIFNYFNDTKRNDLEYDELRKYAKEKRVNLGENFKFEYSSFRDLLKIIIKRIDYEFGLKEFIGITTGGISCEYLK